MSNATISSRSSSAGLKRPLLIEPIENAPPPRRPSERTAAELALGTRQTAKRVGFGWIVFALLMGGCIFAGLFYLGWKPRDERLANLNTVAQEVKTALPRVTVTLPKHAAPSSELLLPGNVEAVRETIIQSRTSGYLKRWLVDIGDKVTAGQLLAEIDSPEVDMQLEQSRAVLKQQEAAVEQAKANIEQSSAQVGNSAATLELAEITMKRYDSLRGTAAITEQDLSEKEAAVKTARAAVAASKAAVSAAQAAEGVSKANVAVARADVTRLQVLQSFEKITAPFAGVITARTTEAGALVSAGSGSTTQPLFRLACSDPVRVFIDVPQIYALSVKDGEEVRLMLRELPNESFAGKITRSTHAIDPVMRTLRTEVQIANPSARLIPGMYAQVKLNAAHESPPLMLPGSALIINAAGPQVALVKDGHVHIQSIVLDGDYGNTFGVTGGLKDSDQVVTNPSEKLIEGAAVTATMLSEEPKK